ncbi:hypothetical protein F7725_006089 [Dissostichus mawsoni]|uniref:WH2 domain-containing protein n=1 Tax=Dissostichus mawsoni TaxID=36200 RepID=A0A7J5YT15_DISMA|nr:hypothetical protein F7725_006089 [Dissostichus mawsoni]
MGSNEKGRGALLSDIHKGARLKKEEEEEEEEEEVLEAEDNGTGRPFSKEVCQNYAQLEMVLPEVLWADLPCGPWVPARGPSTPFRSLLPPSPRPPSGRSSSPSPRPPTGRSSSPSMANKPSPPENQRSHRPSLPDISRPSSAGGMKHSTSAPPPPPPFNRGGARNNAPPTPNQKSYAPTSSSNNNHSREKPLPPTPNRGHTSPNSVKPPPSSSRPRQAVLLLLLLLLLLTDRTHRAASPTGRHMCLLTGLVTDLVTLLLLLRPRIEATALRPQSFTAGVANLHLPLPPPRLPYPQEPQLDPSPSPPIRNGHSSIPSSNLTSTLLKTFHLQRSTGISARSTPAKTTRPWWRQSGEEEALKTHTLTLNPPAESTTLRLLAGLLSSVFAREQKTTRSSEASYHIRTETPNTSTSVHSSFFFNRDNNGDFHNSV